MQCFQCQHANRDTAKFCEDCGARLVHLCFHCGHDISPQAKFCEESWMPHGDRVAKMIRTGYFWNPDHMPH